MSTCLEGLAWVSCDIIPNSSDEVITTYQKDNATGTIDIYKKESNKWGDATYFERKFELEQSRTNFLILILTILTLLEGLFGLKNIANFLITQAQSFFILLAGLLAALKIR